MIADVVAGLPAARRADALAVFAQAGEALVRSGLKEQLQARIERTEQMTGLALAYFKLGVPCPFLRDESCSIYPYRPSICREYLVTSPAENCSSLGRAPVARIPVDVRLSEALSRLSGKLLDREPEVIPLTMALEWAEAHREEGKRTWDGRFLLEGLVAELSPPKAS
jgi:Fe-S-cluster containining protein